MPPLNLMAAGGILVYERAQPAEEELPGARLSGPHLPLLGARAFFPTRLRVFVDYQRLEVTIGTEDLPAAPGLLRRLWRGGRVWSRGR